MYNLGLGIKNNLTCDWSWWGAGQMMNIFPAVLTMTLPRV